MTGIPTSAYLAENPALHRRARGLPRVFFSLSARGSNLPQNAVVQESQRRRAVREEHIVK